ncbi:MAG: class I SAM-dependent methyltransferase [Syntrophaceae bacterium]
MSDETNERRFDGKPDRLRSSERLALLEVDRVIALSIEGLGLGRILDVGTGTGVFAEAFHAKGFEVVGIDANGVMLEEARRLVPEAEFKQARAEAIPYGNGEFDLSFLGLLLHETDDPVQALREARRVSRSRVVVLEWPYVHDGHKPPLEHRLSVGRILDIAKRAELEHVEHQRLTYTDLYRMAVEPVKV